MKRNGRMLVPTGAPPVSSSTPAIAAVTLRCVPAFGLAAIEAAVGRRDADPQSPARLFALLLRADPDRAAAARGERFCREVLAATDIEGLDRAWSHPDFLPSAEELDVADPRFPLVACAHAEKAR